MFDEVALSVNLGCKILPGHLVVGRFGQNQSKSLIAISQTLDKLVVHDPSYRIQRSGHNQLNLDLNQSTDDNDNDDGSTAIIKPVYYIAIKDVIKTVSVVTLRTQAANSSLSPGALEMAAINQVASAPSHEGFLPKPQHQNSKDLLLIGCSNSVMVYDPSSQSNLFSINTPTPISALTRAGEPSTLAEAEATTPAGAGGSNWPIICGGSQKIYALRFDVDGPTFKDGLNHILSGNNGNNSSNFNVEISSERSTGDTISCLAQGKLNGLDLILTGSVEHKIRIYPLDSFEQNIQPCKLTIEELAPIACLCPINTGSGGASGGNMIKHLPPAAKSNDQSEQQQVLPSVIQSPQSQATGGLLKTTTVTNEQMNYFAFGLENGIIGVYRILSDNAGTSSSSSLALATATCMFHERLWRHKCKHTPLTMLMYDIDGDGLDELVLGFRSSRLEVRSPFTGQLLAATRCFKTDRLAGLTVIDYHNDGGGLMLVACSISGSLVGYKPKFSKPRKILQGYNLPAAATARRQQVDSPFDFSSPLDEILGYATGGSLDSWPAGDHSDHANLKTIEEEQQDRINQKKDSFMSSMMMKDIKSVVGGADLHIETQNDDTKPGKCDAMQSHELLLKLSALRSEQIELERRACNIYHRSLQQATEFYPTDITISHRWDFDSKRAYLRLTIVISSSVEEIKLIEFEDKSGNILAKSHILMQPAATNNPTTDLKRSHVVVMPFRTKRDVESRLNLRIYCECAQWQFRAPKASSGGGGCDKVGGGQVLARVYGKSVDVPRFSMITFQPKSANEFDRNKPEPHTTGGGNNRKRIRILFRLRDSSKLAQILDWLNDTFLCFKFGQLIENNDSINWIGQQPSNPAADAAPPITPGNPITSSHPGATSSSNNNYMRVNNLVMDDPESFEFNLLDLRHTLLKRISASADCRNRKISRESPSLVEAGEMDADEDEPSSQSLKQASYLTIAHSNGLLKFESENSDLVVALIESLVIDRLQLKPSGSSISTTSTTTDGAAAAAITNDADDYDDHHKPLYEQEHQLLVAEAEVEPILNELDRLTNSCRQLEESEGRIQTELYESADYTNSLMQQFANANELNEFTTAKELLNELFMMLNGTQNSARAQCLNNRSRSELLKQINGLRDKLTFLATHYS